ncbi:MAG TPA: YcxB family protein [Isosphaeraceae bacterium]|jgi:hypothetical protein
MDDLLERCQDHIMRIQFDATLDDFVDVYLRQLRRSKVASGWRRDGVIWAGLIAGLVVFGIIHEPLPLRLAFGGLGALPVALLYALQYQAMLGRRVSQYYREQFGTDEPVRILVELTPAGIWVMRRSTQMIFDWRNVETIRDQPDCIEISMRDGGYLVVRNRAFESPDQARHFLELADQFRNS